MKSGRALEVRQRDAQSQAVTGAAVYPECGNRQIWACNGLQGARGVGFTGHLQNPAPAEKLRPACGAPKGALWDLAPDCRGGLGP
ncbi:hypothetical protein LBMAG41_05750 [Cyanobium sp.]|nr:hypothetical protein LBMAG41_05750 [Cyanobium sp.]